jgi:hypothetical protein
MQKALTGHDLIQTITASNQEFACDSNSLRSPRNGAEFGQKGFPLAQAEGSFCPIPLPLVSTLAGASHLPSEPR